MRGHGCTVTGNNIPDAVQTAIAMKNNAQAIVRALPLGDIIYLTPGEINSASPGMATLRGHDRAWEYLLRRAGMSE
jgi:ribulose-5-phosphate 4-epimerase/fuculose-1-phosphate aldolase